MSDYRNEYRSALLSTHEQCDVSCPICMLVFEGEIGPRNMADVVKLLDNALADSRPIPPPLSDEESNYLALQLAVDNFLDDQITREDLAATAKKIWDDCSTRKA